MDGRVLCDTSSQDCSQIGIKGYGFIDSPELKCRTTTGHFDGSKWLPSGASGPRNAERTTGARFIDSENVVCPLHSLLTGSAAKNLTEEVNFVLEISNAGVRFIDAGHLTLYRSEFYSETLS